MVSYIIRLDYHFFKCLVLTRQVPHLEMSLLAQLASDLALMATDAKRRHADIASAAERASKELSSKANGLITPETSIVVTKPIVMALQSGRGSKLIPQALRMLGLVSMGNLLLSSDIPSVIHALNDLTNASPDIQVKILQLLPGFLQSYQKSINGENLSVLLDVCASLQGANRQPAIAHTAQATFSQLLDTVFGKVKDEETIQVKGTDKHDVKVDDDQIVEVSTAAYDAYRVVSDLCTLIEHHKPFFLKTNYIAEDYGFEIIESLITNNKKVFLSHVELGFVLRTKLTPILLRFLSSSKDFSLMVRVSRLIFLLINDCFDVITAEAEVTLSLLTHLLNKNSGTSNWKRIMSLEIFAKLFLNTQLLKNMFTQYDNNQEEERKTVINDILMACLTILNDNRQTLNTGDLIQKSPEVKELPNPPNTASSLHRRESTLSLRAANFISSSQVADLPYLNAIDKPDPPAIPATYYLVLIHQIIERLVLSIDALTNLFTKGAHLAENELDKDQMELRNFLSAYITKTSSPIVTMFDIFIHSSIDNSLFDSTLNSLRLLCVSCSQLGLEITKLVILNQVAQYIVKLQGKAHYTSRVYSIGESIVGTISQAVQNMATPQTNQFGGETFEDQLQSARYYPRNINPRQIFTMERFLELCIQLGDHLGSQGWFTVVYVMQWVSYYIDGPSGIIGKDVPQFSPFLTNNDLKMIEKSLSDFNKNVNTVGMFEGYTKALIDASGDILIGKAYSNPIDETSNDGDDTKENQLIPTDTNTNTKLLCAFNKAFPLDKLSNIFTINPVEFIIKCPENGTLITDYLGSVAKDRTLDDELRLSSCRNMDSLCKACANYGFNYQIETSSTLNLLTEQSVLKSLSHFMDGISHLEHSDELLVINVEVQMYLQILDTLKSIIDKYGSLIKQTWGLITQMLNFPFVYIDNYDQSVLAEGTIEEILTLIIKSSFESLKVILDEVLQSIPRDQIKVIIDSLKNFVSQKFDLNISFNAVSYLWVVNDFLKGNIDMLHDQQVAALGKIKLDKVKTKKDLINIVTNATSEDKIDEYSYNCYLWLYLFSSFVSTTLDERVRVRDAAIITFFDIIESFPLENTSWKLIYDIILKPSILDNVNENTCKDDMMASTKTCVTNVTRLFINKLPEIGDKLSDSEKYWSGLIQYYIRLLGLSGDSIELNTEVYINYLKVVNYLSSDSESSNDLLNDVYQFWDHLVIDYHFDTQRKYFDSLISIVDCFEPCVNYFNPILTQMKFSNMIDILVKCIGYPVMESSSANDNIKLTRLQKAVLENFEYIQNNSKLEPYKHKTIKSLCSIVKLPFNEEIKTVRSNIKKPTFISSSYTAMILLGSYFDSESSFDKILNDGTLGYMFESLISVSKYKNDEYAYQDGEYLWMKATNVLVIITGLFCTHLTQKANVSQLEKVKLDEMVQFILETLDSTFNHYGGEHNKEIEKFDLDQYTKLKDSILIIFDKFDSKNSDYQINDQLIEDYIASTWQKSFMNEHDDIFKSFLPKSISSSKDMQEIIKIVTDDSKCDNYGLTSNANFAVKALSKSCLADLSSMVNPTQYPNLSSTVLSYLIARYALTLRKYISDVQILGHRPAPKVQEMEMDFVINGMSDLVSSMTESGGPNNDQWKQIKVLYPMLVKCLMFGERVNDIQLTEVCIQLGSI